LSVEISNSGSSRRTYSPGFLSHLVMVPSKMLSPIWGMTTSVGIEVFALRTGGPSASTPNGHYKTSPARYRVWRPPVGQSPTRKPQRTRAETLRAFACCAFFAVEDRRLAKGAGYGFTIPAPGACCSTSGGSLPMFSRNAASYQMSSLGSILPKAGMPVRRMPCWIW
jgi:hypothetical protein